MQACSVRRDWANATDDAFNFMATIGATAMARSAMAMGSYEAGAVALRGDISSAFTRNGGKISSKMIGNPAINHFSMRMGRSNGFLGSKGFELKNPSYQPFKNSPTTIQGRAYSGHALDQMQNRGFTPSVIEEIIQNGTSMPNKVAGRMQSYETTNKISVITEDGKVVTVMYGRPN